MIVVLSALFLFILRDQKRKAEIFEPDYSLTVHFIDAGQGDATLIEGPDFTILIDAGRHDDEKVIRYMHSTDVQQIDLLVGTHPHADHIGQFPQILRDYPVDEVWMSGELHTTLTFENALDAILGSDALYKEPRAGETHIIGSATIQVIHPANLIGNHNHSSIVVKINYLEVSLLFMGDAEYPSEVEILNRGHAVEADILKLGHHGSSTSSSSRFLREVNPDVAIYSAGYGNPYGHPHTEVMNKLAEKGISVYGTDTEGTILVESDGQTYSVRSRY